MNWEPERYILGIRHKRIFKFMNHSGEILDELIKLQGKDAFPLKCFSRFGKDRDGGYYKLHDDEETFIVEVNTDGVIFTVDMDAEPVLKVQEIEDSFCKILDIVFKVTGGNSTIDRIGIVNTFKIEDIKDLPECVIGNIVKINSAGQPDDIAIRTSFKAKTEESKTKGGCFDYKNAIIQMMTTKKDADEDSPFDTLRASIDYQIYFKPFRSYKKEYVIQHHKDFKDYRETILTSNFSKIAERLDNVS